MKNQEYLKQDFDQWAKEPVPKEFERYEIFGDKIAVRLYYFNASKYNKKSQKIYKDFTSEESLLDEINSKLYSVGKVLAVGTTLRDPWSSLKPGDLVIVEDWVTGTELNKEWEQYQALALEKPGLRDRVPEPPMMQGAAMRWKDNVFLENKFTGSMRVEDATTFVLQERYILGKYRYFNLLS